MPPNPRAVPAVVEADSSSLERYLESFDWPQRNAAIEEMIIRGGMPLWREILGLIPAAGPRGRMLELGSPPYHTTLLAQRLRPYDVATTAGVIDERRILRQRVASADYAETHEFESPCFDLETEPFPFADASFDFVLFCEVIEHLLANPVHVLSEIHRVLAPGGQLLISTPNAARSGNFLRLWFGGNVFDQYHLGAPLRGSRHSREYTLRELRELVAGCGFAVDVATTRDLGQIQYTRRTRRFEPAFRLLTRFAFGDHGDHLFVRARKEGPFRWHFPREIFDEGHLLWYLDPRAAEVIFGENDVPHTTGFWGAAQGIDGRIARAVGPAAAEVVLVADAASDAVEVDLARAEAAAHVDIEVVREGEDEPLGGLSGELAAMPGKVTIALRQDVDAGARVRVRLRATPAAQVWRMAMRRRA